MPDASHVATDHTAVAEGFSRSAAVYDDLLLRNADGARRLIMSMPDGRWDRVLDVGCGTGFASLEMIRRFGSTRIVGVDPSEGMLDVFRAKVTAHPGVEVTLHAADVMSMPVPPESVDAVVSAMAFHWFPDKPGALREMGRRLRPGGVLAILTSGAGTDAEFERLLREVRPPVPATWLEVFPRIQRDVPWMQEHLERAGLQVVDVWMESRYRRTPPEDYLARIGAVAGHLSADLPPEAAVAHGERVTAAVMGAAGPDGFAYTFNKLFAIARRPEA